MGDGIRAGGEHAATDHTVPPVASDRPLWHYGRMKQIIRDIEAGKVSDELKRRGIPADQRLHIVVESLNDESLPMTRINRAGGAFDWLAGEPDLYSDNDLVERYRR